MAARETYWMWCETGIFIKLDGDNVRRRPKSAEMESEQHLVTVIEQGGVRKLRFG